MSFKANKIIIHFVFINLIDIFANSNFTGKMWQLDKQMHDKSESAPYTTAALLQIDR